MTRTAGEMDVRVGPDVSKFPHELRTALARIEATTSFDATVRPKLAGSFVADLRKDVATAAKKVTPSIMFAGELARGFHGDLNREVKTATAKLSPAIRFAAEFERGASTDLGREAKRIAGMVTPTIHFAADLGRGVAADLKREASTAAGVVSPTVKFDAEFARGLTTALRVEGKAIAERLSPIAKIRFGADFDRTAARRDLRLGARGLTNAAKAKVQFEGTFGPGQGQVLRAQARTLATKISPAATIKFDASIVGMAAEKAKAKAEAATGIDMPLRPDSSGFGVRAKALLARVDLDVGVDLNPNVAGFAAKAQAAVTAASGGGGMNALPAMLVGGAAVAGPTLAAAGAFGVAIAKAGEFQDSLAQLSAVAIGTSKRDLAALEKQALDLGGSTAWSAGEVVTAQTELIKAGVTVQDALGGATAGALALATAGSLDLGRAAEITSQQLNVFGLKGDQAGWAADVLAAGANKSAADVDTLAMAMSQAGNVAAALGIPLDDAVGALSMFSQKGLQGSDAGTSLKSMLMRLNPQSKQAAGLMKKLGLDFFDAQGEFVGLAGVAGQLQTAMGDMSQKQRSAAMQTIFGTDAVRAANIFFSEGEAGVKKWSAAVDDSGYASKVAGEKLNSLKGDLTLLKSAFETAMIGAGSGATEPLRGMVREATKIIGGMGPAIQQVVEPVGRVVSSAFSILGPVLVSLMPPLATFMDSLATGLDAAAPGLTELGKAFGDIMVAFSPFLAMAGEAIGILVQGLAPALSSLARPEVAEAMGQMAIAFAQILVAMTPIIPPLAIVIAGIATLTAKALQFKPVVMALTGAFAALMALKIALFVQGIAASLFGLQLSISPVVLAVAAVAGALFFAYQNFEPFRNVVDSVGRVLRDVVWPAVVGVAKVVGGVLVQAWKAVWPWIKKFGELVGKFHLNTFMTVIRTVSKLLRGDFSGAWDEVVKGVKNAGSILGDLAGLLGDAIGGVVRWFTGTAVPAIVDAVAALLEAAVGWVAEWAPKLVEMLGIGLVALGTWYVGTAAPWLIEQGAALLEAAVGWVAEWAPKLIGMLWDGLGALGEWYFGTYVPWLIEQGAALLTAAVGWAAEYGPKAIEWLGGALVSLGAWFVGTALPWMIEKSVELTAAILGWAVEFGVTAAMFLGEALVSLGQWFATTAVPWMLGKAADLLGALVSFAINLPFRLVELFGTALVVLGQWFAGTAIPWMLEKGRWLVDKLIEGAQALGEKLVEWAGAAFEWLKNDLPRLGVGVIEWFKALPGKVVDAAVGLGQKLGEWAGAAFRWLRDDLPTAVAGVLEWFRGLPGRIVSAVGNLAGTLFNAGKDLIRGLLDGILNIGSAAGDIARGVGRAIVDWINANVIDAINSAVVIHVAGFTIDPPDIPRLRSFHTGGIVPGVGDVPILAKGGEGVFTQDQMRALGAGRSAATQAKDDPFAALAASAAKVATLTLAATAATGQKTKATGEDMVAGWSAALSSVLAGSTAQPVRTFSDPTTQLGQLFDATASGAMALSSAGPGGNDAAAVVDAWAGTLDSLVRASRDGSASIAETQARMSSATIDAADTTLWAFATSQAAIVAEAIKSGGKTFDAWAETMTKVWYVTVVRGNQVFDAWRTTTTAAWYKTVDSGFKIIKAFNITMDALQERVHRFDAGNGGTGGVPRFHSGGRVTAVGPGEVPAVLKIGELVLTESQAAAFTAAVGALSTVGRDAALVDAASAMDADRRTVAAAAAPLSGMSRPGTSTAPRGRAQPDSIPEFVVRHVLEITGDPKAVQKLTRQDIRELLRQIKTDPQMARALAEALASAG